MNDMMDKMQRVLARAFDMSLGMSIGGKAAVRRIVGTSEWRHDPERVAAAEAKRERRRKRAGGASC